MDRVKSKILSLPRGGTISGKKFNTLLQYFHNNQAFITSEVLRENIMNLFCLFKWI